MPRIPLIGALLAVLALAGAGGGFTEIKLIVTVSPPDANGRLTGSEQFPPVTYMSSDAWTIPWTARDAGAFYTRRDDVRALARRAPPPSLESHRQVEAISTVGDRTGVLFAGVGAMTRRSGELSSDRSQLSRP